MEKEKRKTLYKHTYTYTFEHFFKVDVVEYNLIEKDDRFVDENNFIVVQKNLLGKLDRYDEHMWLLEKNIEFYINELVKKKQKTVNELNRFINACGEYKNTLAAEKRPKVKIYSYSYSFPGGISVFEHEAKEHDAFYCVNTNTTIDKDLIDEIINHGTGTLGMYSLEKNEEKFKKKVIDYIKETA